jgi:hypothetical protein
MVRLVCPSQGPLHDAHRRYRYLWIRINDHFVGGAPRHITVEI